MFCYGNLGVIVTFHQHTEHTLAVSSSFVSFLLRSWHSLTVLSLKVRGLSPTCAIFSSRRVFAVLLGLCRTRLLILLETCWASRNRASFISSERVLPLHCKPCPALPSLLPQSPAERTLDTPPLPRFLMSLHPSSPLPISFSPGIAFGVISSCLFSNSIGTLVYYCV